MFKLTNKVALVTGARRGMGRAHALTLAAQGAKVAVTDVDLNDCQKVVEEISATGGEARAYQLDVSAKDEVDKVFDQVVKDFGRLDILINNAGVYLPKLAMDLTEEDWDKTMAINLKGEFLCSQYIRKSSAEMGKSNSLCYHMRSSWPCKNG